MQGAGFIGAPAPQSGRRRRNGVSVAIGAIIVPASVALVAGQSLSETPNWQVFTQPTNYTTTAPGESIAAVTVNYLGTTGQDSTPLADGNINHFSVTVTDTAGNKRDFVTQSRVVRHLAPTVSASLPDQHLVRGTGLWMLDASAAFTGSDLVYSINSLPGVSIDSGTGALSFDTNVMAIQLNTSVSVTVTNSGGSTTSLLLASVKQGIVFPVLGQSNAIGLAPFDGGAAHPLGTLQYGQGNVLAAATLPLDHSGGTAGDMGLDVQFALDYTVAHPTHAVVFVPRATGGSGFSNGRWSPPSSDLYADAVADINAVLSTYPLLQLGGFLWHQGETDAIANTAGYADLLKTLIAAVRTDVTAADQMTPFVMGGLLPGAGSNFDAFTAQIEAVAEDLSHTTFANASDLNTFDGLHFDAASLRTLGARYFAQWIAAQTDVVVPLVPDQVTGLVTVPESTSVTLFWTAPDDGGSALLDYLVEYSSDGGSTWTLFADGLSPATTMTVTGLASGQAYVFRVSGVNAIGTGPASVPTGTTTTTVGALFEDNADGTVISVSAGMPPSPTFTDNEDGTVERIN